MKQWHRPDQGAPIKGSRVVFYVQKYVVYAGEYDGLVFRPDGISWFWHPSEISRWRYEDE